MPNEGLIDYEGPEFDLFCDHVNSRLCVMDFMRKLDELATEGYDANASESLILPIQQEIVQPLFGGGYAVLIEAVCKRIAIQPYSLDSLRSQLEDEAVVFFSDAMRAQTATTTVRQDATIPALVVEVPDLLSDLILCPVAQIHTEVTCNARHFQQMIDALGGDSSRLLLNAHASSVFSMFILTWVAQRMNVSLNYGDSDTTVAVV